MCNQFEMSNHFLSKYIYVIGIDDDKVLSEFDGVSCQFLNEFTEPLLTTSLILVTSFKHLVD